MPDTDAAKSFIFDRIARPNHAPGSWMINADASESYCREMAAEARVEEKPGKFVWKRIERDNHAIDAEVYAYGAAVLWGLHQKAATRTRNAFTRAVAEAADDMTNPDPLARAGMPTSALNSPVSAAPEPRRTVEKGRAAALEAQKRHWANIARWQNGGMR